MPPAADVLATLEKRWRDPLREVSLVAEVGAADDDVLAAIRALGSMYVRAWDAESRWRLLRVRYPACVVVAMPGVGALHYEHGNYWSGLWDEASVDPNQDDPAEWSDAFRSGLEKFKLARFEGLPLRNVGEIMMHAGIPVYGLADFLELLLQRQARDPAVAADALLAWATMPGHESRLQALDKPVQRFLQYGADYAEDFVDRCLELLDRLRLPAFDADGLGLPERIIVKARDLAADGLLDLSTERRWPSRTGLERPGMALEPFDGGLLIRLPAVPDAPGGVADWQVHLDGELQVVRSRSPWPGATETAPATALQLRGPAHSTLVRLPATGQEWEIDLVDRTDPRLVFTEDGRRIPAVSALPPEPVWLLHPKTDQIDGADIEVCGTRLDLGDAEVPYGWERWRLHRVDLEKASAIRLGTAGWRSVQSARRARLTETVPLRGVRTAYERPVIAAPPRVELPADPGVTTHWSIRIRRPGAPVPLVACDIAIDRDQTVDPWEGLTRPLVGPFELTVRGPLGRGLSRTLVVVEGLDTACRPGWRRLTPTGVVPATVSAIPTVEELRIDPSIVRLGSTDATAQFTVLGPDCTEHIRVTTPHMAVQRMVAGEYANWSLRPLRLATESLGDGKLLVRLPAPMPAQLIVRGEDTDLQVVSSEYVGGQNLARFDLGRIADTVRAHGSAHLEVQVETLRYPVARCEPRRLAQGLTLDEDCRLVLSGAAAVGGLAAGCYQIYAPWREPVVLPVEANLRTAPLPDRVRHCGPLVVALRIDDPWLPAPWPDWPTGSDSFLVNGGGWTANGAQPGEAALSGFLAGASPLIEDPACVGPAGLLYHRADDLARWVGADIREASAVILAANPREALAAVADGKLSGQDAVAPLVHAGLVALPRPPYLDPDDELRLWTTSPLAAVVASSHRLGDPRDEQLRERVIDTCGAAAEALLVGAPDPCATAGAFNDVARLFGGFSAEQLEAAWREAAVIPRGLLSADERTAAARQLFDARHRPGVERVARQARQRLSELSAVIHQHSASAAAAISARGGSEGWLGLSRLSLAFALVARLAARDRRWSDVVTSFAAAHATLARHAPRLVTVDVLLAELLLTGADA